MLSRCLVLLGYSCLALALPSETFHPHHHVGGPLIAEGDEPHSSSLSATAAVGGGVGFALQADQQRLALFDPLESNTKVPVSLAVMSKCPDAQVCEILFDRVLDQVGGLVDLQLVYIGSLNETSSYGVHCMHGKTECTGNIQQLCVAKYWQGLSGEVNPWADWWNFVQCVNYGPTSRIGEEKVAQGCAKVVGHEWDDQLATCVSSDEGASLLRASVSQAQAMQVTKSCTIILNGKAVCVHDGTWKQCPQGHEVGDFVRQIKTEWRRLNEVGLASSSSEEGEGEGEEGAELA